MHKQRTIKHKKTKTNQHIGIDATIVATKLIVNHNHRDK